MRGVAFCPAHVTGFFKADVEQQKPELMGSLGAGFSIKEGVTTIVSVKNSNKNDFQINISGYETDNTDVSKYVVNEFLKLTEQNYSVAVHHDIAVPIGYGLGCSGAVALSLAFALDQALGTKLSKEGIGKIAHIAEVSCKTGLGDVIGAFHGGFEIRTKSGAPGVGSLEKIDTHSKVIIICFSPVSTKKFLDENLAIINGLGGKMVDKLIQTKDYNEFQDMSVEFAKYVRIMTPTMDSVISELDSIDIKSGVALFGETIFTLVPEQKEDQVLEIFKRYDNGILIQSEIDNVGARLQ
ncbi:MAG: GHMP kinase [Thaumarchaeota archaeon]|nr:GHMP kinase [Nitrososphaerota archaeon]